MSLARLLHFLLLLACCHAIGMQISPISSDDTKLQSSTKKLHNCLGYLTLKDDLVLVKVNAGERLQLQQLNLRVFDADGNVLRGADSIAGQLSFIFTNLNNPVQIEQLLFLDRFKPRKQSPPLDLASPGSTFVYICFDNLFYDKLWSFNKQPHNVDLQVQLRNASTLGEIDYRDFAKYFSRLKPQKQLDHEKEEPEFTRQHFEIATNQLGFQLQEISESLRSLAEILNILKQNQALLRGVNELIFTTHTLTSISIIGAICAFGAAQIVYFMCFCKSKRLI